MMNRKEFYEYVKDNVKAYLPKSYEEGEIKLQEVEKNKQVAIGKIKALENQKNEKESGNLFGSVERQILNTYKEMFERNRQIMDDFFGCPGAMQKLFGDANYMDMYDDLFEQFEPHFEAMQLNTETIKERLKKKYQKRQNDVLS